MRHTGETIDIPARRTGEDTPSIASKPSRTPDGEEWAWMVDEDPAFYLSEAASA